MRFAIKLALALLLISLVVGQLIRAPLPGQGGGVLVSDIAVVLILVIASLSLIRQHRFFCFRICLCFVLFALWSLFTLTIQIPKLGLTESLIAFSYWLRLSTSLLLLPALLIIFQDKHAKHFAHRGLLLTIITLVALGFLQLISTPNLNLPGWDPHRFRLTSTWLDPNFFGGFLVVVMPFLLVTGHRSLVIFSAAALILTQSRTSFLAFGASLAFISPIFLARLLQRPSLHRYMFLGSVVALGAILGVLSGFVLQDRALGALTLDPTATLRVQSLVSAFSLAQEHTLLGVGYNAYQFAAHDAGFISNFTIHSRAGADNSLLTLWVTTGLVGVVLFLLPWVYAAWHLPVAGLISLLALTIHSQLVNSFLYSHLLITLIIIIALLWRPTTPSWS